MTCEQSQSRMTLPLFWACRWFKASAWQRKSSVATLVARFSRMAGLPCLIHASANTTWC